MRTFSSIQINRKDTIHEELMNNYQIENDLSQQPQNQPLPPVQNPYENMLMHEIKGNMQITRNGEKISGGDYYGDFQDGTAQGVNQTEHIQPYSGHVDQVDPASFFGNSMGGVINQLKK